ncbi:MAG: serine/threonine protein kinase [Planctomycetaceae bacterium]|nr:serine/threonine protein kinase [Planctomycetaceae bacterium]
MNHVKITGDSDKTVLSDSPPLDVLAASTIEHQGSGLHDTFSRSGMLPPGTQLAHFRVTKYIGGGGMGRVYLGIDQALDRKVALKVLPMQRAQDSASVARFMNEAKSAARLNHEHIAQVYFAGEHNGIPFIAFEYVQGTNIRSYVDGQGVLPLPQAINYLLQISHALAHAAMHQVIHRDVKPSNILITPGGRAKLIDMGLARLLAHANVDNDLTASGVTLGTFDYISPEQARDPRNADTRSDIYSLGCTFFFMLTGKPPFSEGTMLQKLLQHQGDEPPDVRDYQPSVPLQVSQIIQKMMAKDPRARYQSPVELVEDLTEVAKMIGLRPVGTGSLIWQLPLKGRIQPLLRHLPWLVPCVLFAIVGVLVHSSFFFSAPQTPVPPVVEVPTNVPAGISSHPATPNSSGNDILNELGGRNGNGRNGNDGSNTLADALPLRLRMRSTDTSTAAPTETNVSRNTASATRFSQIGAALEVDSIPASVSVASVKAASYQPNASLTQKQSGNSGHSDNQPPKILIVDPMATERQPNSFKTLRDAAATAAKEATIELRFDGPVDIEYFRFSESTITVKSAAGYRPKIVFRPTTSVGFTRTYSMASLDNSNMLFENVQIEMVIPQSIDTMAERWTMFDLMGSNKIELHNVVLTFNNALRERAYKEKTAFFRCSPVSTPAVMGTSSSVMTNTNLVLTNCFVRGEASLLHCDNPRSVRVDSNNALIAINQPVFSLLDIKPGTMNMITANFNHNTIYAPFLVSWQQGTAGSTLGHPIELNLNDSIVRFHGDSTAMAEYAGGIPMQNVAGFYSRNSFQTFYQNFVHEWMIRPLQSGSQTHEAPPAELPQTQQRFFNTGAWVYQYIDSIPVHSLTKNHFQINKSSIHGNALKSNQDGTYVGIDPALIPETYFANSLYYD